jgi:hypothetical protein
MIGFYFGVLVVNPNRILGGRAGLQPRVQGRPRWALALEVRLTTDH